MSVEKGKELGFRPVFAKIKWVRSLQCFEVLVPDMSGGGSGSEVCVFVYIHEEDLVRMINWHGVLGGDQGELDDETYLGVSAVQGYYFLSRYTLTVVKRLAKKNGRGVWYYLTSRSVRGGHPRNENSERLVYLREHEKEIVARCVEMNWLEEYIMLQKDLGCKDSRKVLVERFAKLREGVL